MKIMTKLTGAILGMLLIFSGCDMSKVSSTDNNPVTNRLSLLARSAHNNPAAIEYEIIDLDPEGSYSVAYGINDLGQIVGIKKTGKNERTSYFWDINENTTRNLGSLGGNYAYGFRINNNGEIAGASRNNLSEIRAVYWSSPNDNIVNLGTFGGSLGTSTSSQAQGINEKGEIVGYTRLPNKDVAFLIDEHGAYHELRALDNSDYSDAIDINDHCQIVGVSKNDKGNFRAVIWDRKNGIQDLGTLGGSSQAWSINNKGQIVGFSEIESGETHAVFWNPIPNADTTPPEISYDIVTSSLWPPNHKMVLAISNILATDNDDNPTITVDVQSTESLNGRGDGNTDPDWEIIKSSDGSYDVWLQAERSGHGSGRIYTVTITAEDAVGNSAEELVVVSVAHNRSR